jgi:hypothetical protein
LSDIQLAITITRAYEGDDGPILKEILEEKVLLDAASGGNRWSASWAFWMLNRRGMAVRSLIVSHTFMISSDFQSLLRCVLLVTYRDFDPTNPNISR